MASGGWFGDYGRISWNTRLRLRDYQVHGEETPLVEEYRTPGSYNETTGTRYDVHWIHLTPFGEQFYRENWTRYRQMYPNVDAADPDLMIE
jgi:hypothetical protein